MAGRQDPWQRDPGDRRGIVIAAAVTLAIVVIIVIAIGMIAGGDGPDSPAPSTDQSPSTSSTTSADRRTSIQDSGRRRASRMRRVIQGLSKADLLAGQPGCRARARYQLQVPGSSNDSLSASGTGPVDRIDVTVARDVSAWLAARWS